MRTIKFRAWQTNYKQMYEHPFGYIEFYKDNNVVGFDDGDLRLEGDDVVLMQYTGLKDRNSKEIYEGDIVNFEGITNYEIKFIRGGFAVDFKDGHRYLGQFANPEIIGNIYENPELLETK